MADSFHKAKIRVLNGKTEIFLDDLKIQALTDYELKPINDRIESMNYSKDVMPGLAKLTLEIMVEVV